MVLQYQKPIPPRVNARRKDAGNLWSCVFPLSLLKWVPWVNDITLSPEAGEGASLWKGKQAFSRWVYPWKQASMFVKRAMWERTHASKCVHGNKRHSRGTGKKGKVKEWDVVDQNWCRPFCKGYNLGTIQLDMLNQDIFFASNASLCFLEGQVVS